MRGGERGGGKGPETVDQPAGCRAMIGAAATVACRTVKAESNLEFSSPQRTQRAQGGSSVLFVFCGGLSNQYSFGIAPRPARADMRRRRVLSYTDLGP